jgi:hypothetical protein
MQGNARSYELRLEDIANLVRAAVKETIVTGSVAANAKPPPPPPSLGEKITGEIAAAKEISRTFNEQVLALREDQALQTLKSTPPRHVAIEAQESEPNDDSLSTNQIALGAWITASIGAPNDADYFTFTSPAPYRDWIRIELQNRCPLWSPARAVRCGK